MEQTIRSPGARYFLQLDRRLSLRPVVLGWLRRRSTRQMTNWLAIFGACLLALAALRSVSSNASGVQSYNSFKLTDSATVGP